MPNTVFCCGIPYEGAGRCIVCDKPLSIARARNRPHKREVRSIIEELEEEKKYKQKLWQETMVFQFEQHKKKVPHKRILCECCAQLKRMGSFQWIKGDREEYNLVSIKFSNKLFEAYGGFINYKRPVCGSCARRYRDNKLPITILQIQEKKSTYDRKRNRKPKMEIPDKCPICGEARSRHHNAWARTKHGIVCRWCIRKGRIIK